jgi:hypothetical protein
MCKEAVSGDADHLVRSARYIRLREAQRFQDPSEDGGHT